MTSVKAVLFDLDGTLVDSNDLHILVWRQVFAEHGMVRTRAAIAPEIGKAGDMLVPALVPDADDALVETLSDRHGEIFERDWLKQAAAFPEAGALLRTLHDRGCKVGLATSAGKADLDHYLDLLGIADIVDATVTMEDVATSKPAGDIFASALEKLGLDAAEVLAVGDTVHDIEAAGKCGLATIAVRSGGYDGRLLQEAGAIAVYDDVAQLLAELDRSPLSI